MAERRLNIPIIVRDQSSAALGRVERNFNNLRGQVEDNHRSMLRWQGGIMGVRTQLMGLAAAVGVGSIVALGKSVVETADRFERMRDSLDMLTKGEGTNWFEELNKWALKMPINTEQAIDSFKMLRAMGLKPTIDDMTTLVDTVLALGLQADGMDRVARALGQIQAKGRLMAQEMDQLRMAGVPVFEILQEKMGLTAAQLADVGKLHLDAQKVIAAVLEGLKERYGGFSQKIQSTYGGLTETIKNYTKEFVRQIGTQGGVLEETERILGRHAEAMEKSFETGSAQKWADLIGSAMTLTIRTADEAALSIMKVVRSVFGVGEALADLITLVENIPERTRRATGRVTEEAESETSKFIQRIKEAFPELVRAMTVEKTAVTWDLLANAIRATESVTGKLVDNVPAWIQAFGDWSREVILTSDDAFSTFIRSATGVTEELKKQELKAINHARFLRELRARERAEGPYRMARGGPPEEPVGPPRELFEEAQAKEIAEIKAAERKAILEEMEKLRKDMDELTGKTVIEQLAYWTKYEQDKLAILQRHGLAEQEAVTLSVYVQEEKAELLDKALKDQKVSYEQFMDFRAGVTEDLKRLTQSETQFELNEIQRRSEERERDLEEWVRKAKEESEEIRKIITSAYGGGAGREAERFVVAIETIERITREMEGATEERKTVLQTELDSAKSVYSEIAEKYIESEDKKLAASFKGLEQRTRIVASEGQVQKQSFQASLAEMARFQERLSDTIQGKQREYQQEINRIVMDQFEYQRWAAEKAYEERLGWIEKEREAQEAIKQESLGYLDSVIWSNEEVTAELIAQNQKRYDDAVEKLRELGAQEKASAELRKALLFEIADTEREANLLKQRHTLEYLEWHLEQLAIQGASIRELEEARIDWMIDNNENFFEGMRLGFKKVEWEWSHWGRRGAEVSQHLANSISNSMSQAFSNIIMGTEGVNEAFARMGEAVIRTILDIIAQLLVEWMIIQMIKGVGSLLGAFGGSGGGDVMGMGQGIPTIGGTGTLNLGKTPIPLPSIGGGGPYFHEGGIVEGGPVTPVQHFHQGAMVSGAVRVMPDEVPAILQKGEAVIPRESARRNRDLVNYLINPWKKIRDARDAVAEIRTVRSQAQAGYGSMTRDIFEKGRAADELVRVVAAPTIKEDYRPVDAMSGSSAFDLSTGYKHEGAEQEAKVGKISRLLQPEIGGAFGGMGNVSMASLGAMMAAQQGPIGGERRKEDAGEPAQVTVNLINQTGTQFRARAGETRYDGKKQIQDVILESLFTNPEFRQSARKGLGVR